mmetsp:Transcript_55702/g.127958  ORF Transcript_55702/g.127958 Transcript_55702/m.127958 type:complete len:270 (+) Transcript_55702:129-938(+)
MSLEGVLTFTMICQKHTQNGRKRGSSLQAVVKQSTRTRNPIAFLHSAKPILLGLFQHQLCWQLRHELICELLPDLVDGIQVQSAGRCAAVARRCAHTPHRRVGSRRALPAILLLEPLPPIPHRIAAPPRGAYLRNRYEGLARSAPLTNCAVLGLAEGNRSGSLVRRRQPLLSPAPRPLQRSRLRRGRARRTQLVLLDGFLLVAVVKVNVVRPPVFRAARAHHLPSVPSVVKLKLHPVTRLVHGMLRLVCRARRRLAAPPFPAVQKRRRA